MWEISTSNSKGLTGAKTVTTTSSLSVSPAVCLSPLPPPSLTVSFSLFVIPAPLILCSRLPNGNPAVSLVLQLEGCQGHSAKQWTGPVITFFFSVYGGLGMRGVFAVQKAVRVLQGLAFWNNTISLLGSEYSGG